MDQLLAMRAFSRVVEAGNFTRAAETINIPNATMSKLVQELEAHLGIKLLQRTTRRVTVTPEGQEYYDKAVRILRDLEAIDSSFDVSRRNPGGKLRIDIGGSAARDVLIPLLPEFLESYPDIQFELGVSDRAVDMISDNVDCVIRGGPLDSSSLIARHIGNAKLITCASPRYLKKYGVPAYPDELKNGHKLTAYLSPQDGRPFPFRFALNDKKIEIKVEQRIGVNESNAHLAAAIAGLGIVQTFSYAACEALRDGKLVEILSEWRPSPYPFHVVYPQNRYVSPRLRVFIDWLAKSYPRAVANGITA
ncbi:LysR family transcriptional regulator [Thalassospira sp. HF15]|uniref:LysR family transcriptional regulator n=1 Tax=Thalassospira sp. HF15 TaxID=2722755 RepID=UPI001432262A|nr:LysR family transcriptional regulator [Thalassospira sp. HF15]